MHYQVVHSIIYVTTIPIIIFVWLFKAWTYGVILRTILLATAKLKCMSTIEMVQPNIAEVESHSTSVCSILLQSAVLHATISGVDKQVKMRCCIMCLSQRKDQLVIL